MSSEIDWQHHTVESLRELCRKYRQMMWNADAKVAACDFAARIAATPQAWRIFGAIDHALTRGYDADHIVKWLSGGFTAYEQADYLQEIAAWRRRAEQAEARLGLARANLERLWAEREGGEWTHERMRELE